MKQNLLDIKKEIIEISKRTLINERHVKILAVSKGQSASKIEQAILSGQVDFAENYLQEAETKWIDLRKKYPHVTLHFIGYLQSNKAKKVLELFDVIHTLDRASIVKKIGNSISLEEKHNKSFLLQLLLDNSSETKKGLSADNIEEVLQECNKQNLNIVGFMGIPNPYSDISFYFSYMQDLAKKYKLQELSMGMSNDYKEALQYGSTMLRIGRGIFGDRET